MKTIQKRRDAMSRAKHPIYPKIVKRIEKMKDEVQLWIPRWFGDNHCEVCGPMGEQYRVDLQRKTCGCRKWETSGIPCVHAMASIKLMQQDPFDYVHECYKVDTYLKCYGNFLSPINGRDLWPQTDQPLMLPPDVKKRSGRPKKARRREPEEPTDPTKLSKRGVKMRCSACRKVGHNKRGCKTPSAPSASGTTTTAPTASARTATAPTTSATIPTVLNAPIGTTINAPIPKRTNIAVV